MDGDAVEAEPSTTITEFFIEMFPYYMMMGMSYKEYWHGPAWLAKSYRDAFALRRKEEEWARHRQGMYFMQALAVALQGFSKDKSHKETYPMEPWPLTQQEANEREAIKEREGYEKALAQRKAEIARRKEMEAIKDGDD